MLVGGGFKDDKAGEVPGSWKLFGGDGTALTRPQRLILILYKKTSAHGS